LVLWLLTLLSLALLPQTLQKLTWIRLIERHNLILPADEDQQKTRVAESLEFRCKPNRYRPYPLLTFKALVGFLLLLLFAMSLQTWSGLDICVGSDGMLSMWCDLEGELLVVACETRRADSLCSFSRKSSSRLPFND
jgi:hypothetical protein